MSNQRDSDDSCEGTYSNVYLPDTYLKIASKIIVATYPRRMGTYNFVPQFARIAKGVPRNVYTKVELLDTYLKITSRNVVGMDPVKIGMYNFVAQFGNMASGVLRNV
jgi:hypothetical protein